MIFRKYYKTWLQEGNTAMKKKVIIAAMITIALLGYAIY